MCSLLHQPRLKPRELNEVWNFGAFENVHPEMVNELAKLRKRKQVYINAPPPPGWQEHRLEEEYRVQEELARRNNAEYSNNSRTWKKSSG